MGACADGEVAPGREMWLGRGPALPFSTTPISGVECVPVWPHLLIRAPTSSVFLSGPELCSSLLLTNRWETILRTQPPKCSLGLFFFFFWFKIQIPGQETKRGAGSLGSPP